jgi:hypothetical protein
MPDGTEDTSKSNGHTPLGDRVWLFFRIIFFLSIAILIGYIALQPENTVGRVIDGAVEIVQGRSDRVAGELINAGAGIAVLVLILSEQAVGGLYDLFMDIAKEIGVSPGRESSKSEELPYFQVFVMYLFYALFSFLIVGSYY